MKTLKLTMLALAVAATVAVAGEMTYTPVESTSAPSSLLFDAGFHLGGHALFLTPDADRSDDTWGGGLNADWFFSPYVGIQGSASWADPGTDEIWHNYTLDLVLRMPIEVAYIAPYVFAGGGAILEDDADILGRVGGGLEFRPTAAFGIFADYNYSFPGGGGGDDDVEDYQMWRFGLKFGF